MQITIERTVVTLSQKTIDAVLAHQAFCSVGEDWLIRNDPCGDLEREFIDEIKDSLRSDYKTAIESLPKMEQDDFWDDVDFFSNDHDGYLDNVIETFTSSIK